MEIGEARHSGSTAQLGESEPQLRRTLGPFDATSVVIGAIIGVGIFFTPQKVALYAESQSLAMWAWVAGGVIALLGALSFAELGGFVHDSGGQYEILRRAYGRMPAFLFVFCNSTAIQSGAIAIIALICADNLSVLFLGQLPAGTLRIVTAIVLIAGVTFANWMGVRAGAAIQNVTVIAKVGTILLVTALAFLLGTGGAAETVADVAEPKSWTTRAFLAALVPVLFSFGGWQHALWIGGEVREPRRNVPRAILFGVSVVIACYLLVNVAYFRLLGYAKVAGAGALAAEAVQAVWQDYGQRAVAGAVAFSAFGVLNAQLLSGPRLIYAMARAGQFFSVFARIQPRFETPAAAILFLGIIGAALCTIGFLDPILNGVVLIDGLFMAATGAAVLVLRRKEPNTPRPIRVPYWVPLLFAIGEVGVVTGAFLGRDAGVRNAAWVAVLWVTLGAALFYSRFRRAP